MRLISQDGMIDVPHEISALSIGFGEPDKKYNIYIRSKLLDEKPCVFATYSTKDKAIKVMEMLRKAYLRLPILLQNVDMDESVVEKLKEWKRDGIVLLHDNAETKIEQVNNAIFVFPKDDEVE